MPTVTHLVEAMESIAPTERAEAWDNVGLLVGDPARRPAFETLPFPAFPAHTLAKRPVPIVEAWYRFRDYTRL